MKNQTISPVRRNRLKTQGYIGYSDIELKGFAFGIRFAYYLCGSLVLVGLALTNVYILAAAMIVALFGSFPPYHPFDYLYNYGIRHLINKPKVPPRTNQGRFACAIATIWIALIIYLFSTGLLLYGYLAGSILIVLATLVSVLDICVPSLVYNALFKKKCPRRWKQDSGD